MQIPQTGLKNMFDVSSNRQSVLTVSNAPASMNPWLTHRQAVVWCSRIDLNGFLKIDAIEQPIKINSAGSGDISQVGAPASDNHVDQSFVVLKKHTETLACRKCALPVSQNRSRLSNWFLGFAFA